MSFDFLYNPATFLVQLCINWLVLHGVAPVNGANVEGAYLHLLTVKAGGV